MLSWLAGKMIGYVLAQNRAGNIRPMLWLAAPDVTLTFPGDNSWSGVYRGRDTVRRWMERTIARRSAGLSRRGGGQRVPVADDAVPARHRSRALA